MRIFNFSGVFSHQEEGEIETIFIPHPPLVISLCLVLVSLLLLGVSLYTGLFFPLAADKAFNAFPTLAAPSSYLFPYTWIFSLLAALLFAFSIFTTLKIYHGTRNAFNLFAVLVFCSSAYLLLTSILLSKFLPRLSLGVASFDAPAVLREDITKFFYPTMVVLLVASFLIFFFKNRFNRPETFLPRYIEIALLLSFLIPTVVSSAFFSYSQARSISSQEDLEEAIDQAGFTLYRPTFLPEGITRSLKIKKVANKQLGVDVFRQIYTNPITKFDSSGSLFTIDQVSIKESNLEDLLPTLGITPASSIAIDPSLSATAYLHTNQQEPFKAAFLTKTGLLCLVTATNTSKRDFEQLVKSFR